MLRAIGRRLQNTEEVPYSQHWPTKTYGVKIGMGLGALKQGSMDFARNLRRI